MSGATGATRARDGAYHQGTVWPWLIGPFVDAWLAVRGRGAAAKDEARRRFLPPLLAHLGTAGLGHVSEVADGDAPHAPGGCPFQVWSLGELLRVRAMLDVAEDDPDAR
jgi:glycogen debranching enzyme